jgi:tryptophanase
MKSNIAPFSAAGSSDAVGATFRILHLSRHRGIGPRRDPLAPRAYGPSAAKGRTSEPAPRDCATNTPAQPSVAGVPVHIGSYISALQTLPIIDQILIKKRGNSMSRQKVKHETNKEAVEAAAGQPDSAAILLESDVRQDETLARTMDEILLKYNNEETAALAVPLIAPYIFFGKGRNSFFRLNERQGVILAWPYVGSEADYPGMVYDLYCYAKEKNAELNILSTVRLSSVFGVGFTATPFGVRQKIVNLPSFCLDEQKMRHLRDAVNKFMSGGDCRTLEYRVGESSETDQKIARTIDGWCEINSRVNPCVPALKRDIQAGHLETEHRVFLTYVNDELINVILTMPTADGYVTDMEFYPEGAPFGALEFAITQIIQRLVEEGCRTYSLGGTYGPEIVESPNADPDVRTMLEQLRSTTKLGQGGLQSKNKFRPENRPIYLCKPLGGDPSNVVDILMMIADPELGQGQQNQGRKSTSPRSPASCDSAARAGELREYGYNPALIPGDKVEFDMFTDSWAELQTDYVQYRIQMLRHSVVDNRRDPVDSLREIFPFPYILPVSSGRYAESLLCKAWPEGRPDVVQNLLFPTFIFNQIDNGLEPVELPDKVVFDFNAETRFKGGLDLSAVKRHLEERSHKTGMICVELSDDAAGGYPLLLEHLRHLKMLAAHHEVPLVMDVTRILDNALLINEAETGQQPLSIWAIVHEICGLADGITGSLTKNFSVSEGGIVAVRDPALFEKILGFAADDSFLLDRKQQALLAVGLQDRQYIERQVAERIEVVSALWRKLDEHGIPVVSPAGGHCVLIDVERLPQFPALSMPVEALIAWLYRETGIRCGAHNTGMQKSTRLNKTVRLAVPVGLSKTRVLGLAERLVSALSEVHQIFDLEVSHKPAEAFGNIKRRYRVLRDVASDPDD